MLKDTVGQVKGPYKLSILLLLCAVAYLSVDNRFLNYKLDGKGDERNFDYKKENDRKDSIIRNEREINRKLRDTIPIIITNCNDEKIKIYEEIIKRFKK